MPTGFVRFSLFVTCLSIASLTATAQEVVHALAGTVVSIDPAAKTITIKTDDGSEDLFKDMINNSTTIEFDSSIRTDATAADEFKKSGVRAIVYYFGIGDRRTVVALRSLGPGPFTIYSGMVVKYDKESHGFSIKDKAGAFESFKINSTTVVETDTGAREGLKNHPDKGQQVRVTAAMANGSATALFINDLTAD